MSLSTSMLQSATIFSAFPELLRFANSLARTLAAAGLWAPSTQAPAFPLPGKGVYRPGHNASATTPRAARAKPAPAMLPDAGQHDVPGGRREFPQYRRCVFPQNARFLGGDSGKGCPEPFRVVFSDVRDDGYLGNAKVRRIPSPSEACLHDGKGDPPPPEPAAGGTTALSR